MAPRVSVLLPAFNAADTLAAAISSVQAQTFADWELLAIDDGSDDGTAQVAQRAAERDSRIKVFRLNHGGIVATLNAGLEAARGELIARMDADDLAHPERLARQMAYLDANPDIGLVSCLVDFGGDLAGSVGYALHVDWLNSLLSPEEIRRNRFVESPLAHPSVLFRRELAHLHGGYRDGPFPEDYELWLRWMDAGVRMAKVPQSLLRWNDPPKRLSRNDPRYDPDAFFRVKAPWLARELQRLAIGTAGGRTLFVWGAGRPTRKRAAPLSAHGVTISGYIDVDPKKCGRRVDGRPVIAPAALPSPASTFVLGYVGSRGARDLIRSALRAAGYVEETDFLMCA